MLGIKSKVEVGWPDSDILADLAVAVKEQHKKDGTSCTPLGSDAELHEMLTDRWRGTKIVARVAKGSPASITKAGVYDETPGRWGERTGLLVRFPEAEGEVESMSPAYGGYIALTDGHCIGLPTRDTTRPLPLSNYGLEVEVAA